MNIFTVSLFGHHMIDDHQNITASIKQIIKELLQTREYVVFLIGRNGEFDEYVASVIKNVQKELRTSNSALTLVLPYTVADIEYYEKYYDDIIIPEAMHRVYSKAAITLKNQWMLENSDLAIFYVKRKKGGAYTALKYAEKMNVETINICSLF